MESQIKTRMDNIRIFFFNNHHVLMMYFLSTIFLFTKAILFTQPYIMGDELSYKSMAYSYYKYNNFYYFSSAQIGHAINIPNFLYQLVISPVFYLGDNFFVGIKLINSLLVSVVVFPVYLLTRELSNEKYALFATFLCILLPENNYVINVMAENLYFPLFIINFFVVYRLLTKPNILIVILSGMLLSLLFFTKPHALAFVIAVETFLLISIAKEMFQRNLPRIIQNLKISIIYPITVIFFIIIFKSLIQGEFVYRFWELGVYADLALSQSGFILSEFIKMIIAHISSIAIIYSIPIILTLYSIIVSFKKDDKSLFVFNSLLIILSSILFVMVMKFTNGIAGHEHYFRLHARYYFMVYPLFLISLFINFHHFKNCRFAILFILVPIFLAQYFILFKLYASNFGFVSDNPGLSWIFVLKDNVYLLCVITFVNFIIIILSYFVTLKKTIFWFILFIFSMFILSGWAHIKMANSLHHKNALSDYNATALLKASIDFNNKKFVIIDSGHQNRTNLVFWLSDMPTRVIQLPKGSLVDSGLIPNDTDFIIIFDEFNIKDIRYSHKEILHAKNGLSINILYFNSFNKNK